MRAGTESGDSGLVMLEMQTSLIATFGANLKHGELMMNCNDTEDVAEI